jgi:glycosyltransferase involved in cell wall biosynthesis
MIPGPNVAAAIEVLRFARNEGFELLHSHGYKGNVQFGLMPSKLRKIPLVATVHGWTSTIGLTKNRVYEWLDSLSHKFIDAVVLVNQAMKSDPKFKNRNGTNLHVVNNGIPIMEPQFNDSTTQPFDKEIEDFCSKGYTIGSIGRLSTEKGYGYSIKALALLLDVAINARLIIIGEGYERDYLEGLVARLKLKKARLCFRDIEKTQKNTYPISICSSFLPSRKVYRSRF